MPNARSIYLAKLIGPVMLAVGIGIVANLAAFRAVADQFLHTPALIFMSGLITMTVGLAIVIAHNDWEPDWRLIITILGWLATISGAVRIIAPQAIPQIGDNMFSHPWLPTAAGLLYLVLGAVLSYFGYPELWAAAKQPRRARRRSRR